MWCFLNFYFSIVGYRQWLSIGQLKGCDGILKEVYVKESLLLKGLSQFSNNRDLTCPQDAICSTEV